MNNSSPEPMIIPFSRDFNASALFESVNHREALARLHLMVQCRNLGVLTGEVGAGKSILIRRLVHDLDPMRYQPVYISMAKLKPRDFYGELLRHGGEEPPFSPVKAKRLWQEMLEARQSQGDKNLVVIIDEAQDLTEAMILELRFVMNHHMDSVSFFSLILAGQPELRRILRLKKYEAIAQRIQLQYHLNGMTNDDTTAYIKHQMKMAKLTAPLFSEGALKLVYAASQGIPRVINNICSQALLEANRKGLEVIEESLVGRILADIDRQRGTAG